MKLKNIILTQDNPRGKTFDLFFQILILFSLVTFSLETLPSMNIYKEWFERVELVIVTFFTIEYFLRIWANEKKWKFIFSFYGLVDLMAILPFYISHGIIDLRSLRIFRFFRLFRIFKLFRYSKAIGRFKDAFISIKNELTIFFVVTLFILYVTSVGIYYFENEAQPELFKSIFHSFWWAATTLTTVGYGDIAPITVGGKIFTFIVLIIGLGVVAVPSALLASALSHDQEKK